MWCDICGNPIQHGEAHCRYCGNAVGNGRSYQNTGTSRVQSLSAAHSTSVKSKPPREAYLSRVRDVFGETARSGLYLAAVICYTLAALISLSTIQDGGSLSVFYDILEEMGISKRMLGDAFSGLEDMIGLATLIPSILTAVSLWLIYAGGFADGEKRLCGVGLTMLTVLQIISLVAIIFSSFFCFGALFGACTELSQYRTSVAQEAQSALSTAVVVLMIIYAIVILVISKTLTTLTKMKAAAIDGVPESEVSSLVGVYCIISGVLTIFSLFYSFEVSILLQGVAMILFGIQLFTYKSTMMGMERESAHYQSGFTSIIRPAADQANQSGSIGSQDSGQSQGQIPTWKRIKMMEKEEKAVQEESTSSKCMFCGAKMLEDQVFCGSCGRRKD